MPILPLQQRAKVIGPAHPPTSHQPYHERQPLMNKTTKTTIAAVLIAASLTACTDDADVVSKNISKAADNFEVQRRVVMFNGITDQYLLTIEGACSITDEGNQLEVTCKLGEDEYKKHFLGLSDNVSYFVEQGAAVDASEYHYRVTFKPQSIIPDPDFRGSSEDTPFSDQNQQ